MSSSSGSAFGAITCSVLALSPLDATCDSAFAICRARIRASHRLYWQHLQDGAQVT